MEKYTFNCPFTRKTKNGFAIYSLADFVAYDIFVLDRLIPLLKLHIAKGKLDTGEMHTQVVGVEVLPTYNWGQKNAKKNKEMRFLNLKKLISSIETGKMPDFMTETCKKEAMYLYDYWQKYLSVCEEEENLSEKDK
jgi:poly-gamma-glutamate synthesis protein (capsule biosynthesis protein)